MADKLDYKDAYLTMMRASEQAIRNLELMQQGTAKIMLVIPVGIRVSDLIEDTYQASIAATIQEAKEATDTIQSSQNEGSATEQSGISGFFSKVTDSITGAVEKLRNVLNRFLEALAVMLVTTCLIPILVLLFFVWLVKLILGVELPPLGMPRRSGEKIGGGEV